MVFDPLTGATMWHMLTFKSTPIYELYSKSSPSSKLFKKQRVDLNSLKDIPVSEGASDRYTINKKIASACTKESESHSK